MPLSCALASSFLFEMTLCCTDCLVIVVCVTLEVHIYMYMCITCVLFVGVGCFGAASIFITQHIPSKLFAVLRLVDLEVLSSAQLEDVQNEMKFSQMLQHPNIADYLHSFVVGSKLWAIQSLMHYGKSIYLYIYVFEPVLSCDTCTYWRFV